MIPTFEQREIDWTPDRVRRFWAYLSRSPQASDAYFSSHSGDALIRFVERLVPIAPGQRLLDWGCGPGFLLERLCRRGFDAEGLEFSSDSLKQAVDRCAAFRNFRGVTLVERLPSELPAASYDVVFLIEVIEHLQPDEIRSTLSEIHRLLKPSGAIVVTTPHRENLAAANTICPDCGLVFHPWQHVGSFTAATLGHLMTGSGFDRVFCEATTIDAGSLSRAVRRIRRIVGRDPLQPHLAFVGRVADTRAS